MFSELPKLFGKSFAIGFYLPGLCLFAGLLAVYEHFCLVDFVKYLNTNLIGGVAVAALAAWTIAVALMALNRAVLRTLQGYGIYNPFKIIAGIQRKEFRSLSREFNQLRTQLKKQQEEGLPTNVKAFNRFGDVKRLLAQEFPPHENFVLPTRFGNRVRAFESYSIVMYGLDNIPAWPRLVAVIPSTFRSFIDDAKSQVDFWANLWLGGLLVAGQFVLLACSNLIEGHSVTAVWVPVLALAFSYGSACCARASVRGWASYVMSAYDLFRSDLLAKLGFETLRNIQQERALWDLFSEATAYREKGAIEDLALFRSRIPSSSKEQQSESKQQSPAD